MTGELFINHRDAWTTWGVSMGDGFLDAIDAPAPLKEFAEDESRREHGKRVNTSWARLDSRELTLSFTIVGTTPADFRTKKTAFEEELRRGGIVVRVPALGEASYRLIYNGRNVSYALSTDRCACRLAARFTEPNPDNRTTLA